MAWGAWSLISTQALAGPSPPSLEELRLRAPALYAQAVAAAAAGASAPF